MNFMKAFRLENETKIEFGFIFPKIYFDNFSESLIQELTKEKPKVISILSMRKIWIYSDGVEVVMALIILVYNHFHSHSSEINDVKLENYRLTD